MASNPRIDDLRKRLEKDPGSRLFAQLAEELRKAGELDEAIVLSRDGLQKHPAYPSARMTLGRALFDKGDLAGARRELEAVLKGAADNILASRLLAESLDGLGDIPAAVERYRITLAMAPGDRQIASRLAVLEAKLESASRGAPAAGEPAPPQAVPEAPIPLVAADEAFELERPYEAGGITTGGGEPPGAAPEQPLPVPETEAALVPDADSPQVAEPEFSQPGFPVPQYAFELAPEGLPRVVSPLPDPPGQAPGAAPPGELFEFVAPDDVSEAVTVQAAAPPIAEPPATVAPPLADRVPPPEAMPDFVPEPPRMLLQAEEEPPPPWVEPAAKAPEPPAADLISSTLAELYFNQGFTDKAIEVYRQVLAREPANERARTRLGELQQLETHPRAEEASVPPGAAWSSTDAGAARRQAIERVISRLEGLRSSLTRR